MRVIAVANQKGGCGKTTTSVNLAASLSFLGKRVLLIDSDPQGHASLGLGIKTDDLERTLYDVLDDSDGRSVGLEDVVVKVSRNLDLVPAQIVLSGIEQKLSGASERELKLAHKLKSLRKGYHFVIMDCPPSVGLLTFNALCAAGEVLIPVEPSYFSLHGLKKLIETIQFLEEQTGRKLQVHACITNFDGRASFAQEVLHEVRNLFGEGALNTVIRRNIRLQEAARAGKPITEFDRHANGFKDYLALAAELIERESLAPLTTIRRRMQADVSNLIHQINLVSQETPMPIEAVKEETVASVEPEIPSAVFTLAVGQDHVVLVAGSFNHWVPEPMHWSLERGLWEKKMALQPGKWAYKFVVDGEWIMDPACELYEQTEYGAVNSVIEVESQTGLTQVHGETQENTTRA